MPFGLNGQLIQAAFKQCPQKWLKTEYLWRDGLMLQNGSAQAVLQLNKHKTRIDLTLRGDKDNNAFSECKSLLNEINTLIRAVIGKSQRITPFIEIDEQLIALSLESLNGLLNNVYQFENLIARIKEMSQGNTTFISGNIGQATTGDNSPNIQTSITTSMSKQDQIWQQVLEEFAKAEFRGHLSNEQKDQLESLKEIQQLPDSKKSIIKKILEEAPAMLGTTADLATITGFYAVNAYWISPLILSMLGQN